MVTLAMMVVSSPGSTGSGTRMRQPAAVLATRSTQPDAAAFVTKAQGALPLE